MSDFDEDVYDSALDTQASAAAAARMEQLEEIRSDYQATFDSPAGQRTLLSLYDYCGQLKPTFRADDPNGRRSAFEEGKRSVILMILEHVQMDDLEIIERGRRAALRARSIA